MRLDAPQTTPILSPGATAFCGLTSDAAARRLVEDGPNELSHQKGASPFSLLAAQFKGAMIWLLLGACGVSIALGDVADALAIGAIVFINAIVGFLQEYRAERALLALRAMSAPRARVLRDGHSALIPSAQVVTGDVLLLEGGDIVAADARVREAHALQTTEAILTGESAPVSKDITPSSAETPLAEQTDRVFLGTAVTAGRGIAEVEFTGMRTEMGKIAGLLTGGSKSVTPLQAQLETVGQTLLILCLSIVALVSALGLMRGMPVLEVLISSVALAVAAVPEGLAVVVTIALALGVQRMAARNAIVRRLASVETLGCATVICTDKTGTLTTGRMDVRDVWGGERTAVLHAAASCNDAELGEAGKPDVGDPTEVAILRAAAQCGIHRAEIERLVPRLTEKPFDEMRKRMSVQRADNVLYVKGAPEILIPLCVSGTERALVANQEMAERGLRMLAVALGQGESETGLRLIGLIGIADPPRPEAIEAIAKARRAGIRTVMITGDNPATARAIALEMGIVQAGEDPQGIVYARVTAQDKIEIVRGLKAAGEIVAMTGDGVNDAPAIREADIGIAMGRAGTEVTREASDMILTDDNFGTIIAAVEEGRGVYENIRKTLVYLLAGNAGELALMLAASVMGLPLPLLPLQLLWINLVTDGVPALALVMDPPLPGVLNRPPRSPKERLLGKAQWVRILSVGAMEAGLVLSVFMVALRDTDVAAARGMAFSTLVFCELFRAFAARSRVLLFWQVGVFTNMYLLAVVAVSAFVQIAISHISLTRNFLKIPEMSMADTGVCLMVGLVPVTVMELVKLAQRMWSDRVAPVVSNVKPQN